MAWKMKTECVTVEELERLTYDLAQQMTPRPLSAAMEKHMTRLARLIARMHRRSGHGREVASA